MLAEYRACRDISTLSLKGITLRLNEMTLSCYLQNRSGRREKPNPLLKMLPSLRMLAAEGLRPNGLPWQGFPSPAGSPPAAARFGALAAARVVKNRSCSASIVSAGY